jgi:hypothetical protein
MLNAEIVLGNVQNAKVGKALSSELHTFPQWLRWLRVT